MDLTVTSLKRCEIVKFGGFLDGAAVDQLEKVMDQIFDAGKYQIVFDMSEVTLMSSKAIWLLVNVQKKCKHLNRGELVLAGLNQRIQAALKLVGMDGYFKVYDHVVEAVGRF